MFIDSKMGPNIVILDVILGVPFCVIGEEAVELSLCRFRVPLIHFLHLSDP